MGLLTGFSLIRIIFKGLNVMSSCHILLYKTYYSLLMIFNDFSLSGAEIFYFALKIVFSYFTREEKKRKKFIR